MLDLKRARAVSLQRMHPEYGICARCGTPWSHCEPRTVRYIGCSEEARIAYWSRYRPDTEPPPRYRDHTSSGLFALCTECWNDITPEERLVYYEALWYKHYNLRIRQSDHRTLDLAWEEIQTKILNPELESSY